MPETHVIEYEITEDQAAAAADAVLDSLAPPPGETRLRSFVFQSVVYGLLAGVAMALGIWLKQPWWFFVAPLLMIAVVVVLLGLTSMLTVFRPWHRRHLDESLRDAFRKLDSPRVRWTITDEVMTVQAGRDVRELYWEDVKDVFLTGTFWLLRVEDAPTMLLLADRIPDRTARFLLTRAREVGATIRVAGGTAGEPEERWPAAGP